MKEIQASINLKKHNLRVEEIIHDEEGFLIFQKKPRTQWLWVSFVLTSALINPLLSSFPMYPY